MKRKVYRLEEEILPLFPGDMIIYGGNLKELMTKFLELVSSRSKVVEVRLRFNSQSISQTPATNKWN